MSSTVTLAPPTCLERRPSRSRTLKAVSAGFGAARGRVIAWTRALFQSATNSTFSGPAARREIDLMSAADAFEAAPRQQAMARRRRRIKAPIGSRDHLRAGRSTERDHPRTCLQDG